jgi:hypothetical protein
MRSGFLLESNIPPNGSRHIARAKNKTSGDRSRSRLIIAEHHNANLLLVFKCPVSFTGHLLGSFRGALNRPFHYSLSFPGIVSILEVLFPSLRDSDFNRWKVDEGGGSYIQILGWKKCSRRRVF